jgi:hypothetical protein
LEIIRDENNYLPAKENIYLVTILPDDQLEDREIILLTKMTQPGSNSVKDIPLK